MEQYPRIDEVENPEVGRTYLVPCVKSFAVNRLLLVTDFNETWFSHINGYYINELVPIIGEAHRDPDLGVRDMHYHKDCRFLPDHIYNDMHVSQPITRVLGAEYYYTPFYHPLVMLRQHPEFPWNHDIMDVLQQKYMGCKLIDGYICPHRGISLIGAPIVDGKRICPGHGLAFDPETGECVQRNIYYHSFCPEDDVSKTIKALENEA